jgi:hypothetical protein
MLYFSLSHRTSLFLTNEGSANRALAARVLLTLVLLLTGLTEGQATVCSSTGNGLWTHPSSWSCGVVPVAGDTVHINENDTITIDQNIQYAGDILTVHIYGVLHFLDGGSKINLPCGSTIWIMVGGMVHTTGTGQGSSQTVRICNITYWTHDDGDIGGFEVWPAVPLPVELVTFTAQTSGNGALISWATGSEVDVDHYRIHAIYPNEEEQLVSTLSAAGTSNTFTSYEIQDGKDVPGVRYYRLVEVDVSGEWFDLGLRSVNIRPAEHATCKQQVIGNGITHLIIPSVGNGAGPVDVFSLDGRRTEVNATWLYDGSTALVQAHTLKAGYYIAHTNMGACLFKGGSL